MQRLKRSARWAKTPHPNEGRGPQFTEIASAGAGMAAYQYIYVMKGLTKIYPGGRKVLENIWLSFLPGAKIGVLGLNGAGKSTLLRIMAGVEHNYTGEAFIGQG